MPVARFVSAMSLLIVLTAVAAQESPKSESTKTRRVDRYGDPLPEGAIARLGTTRYRNQAGMGHLAALPDRNCVAYLNSDGIGIMEIATGRTLRHIDFEKGSSVFAHSLAVSNDGKFAAVGTTRFVHVIKIEYGQSPIHIVDMASGKKTQRLRGHEKGVLAVEITPDDKFVISLGGEGVVCVWDIGAEIEDRRFSVPDRLIKCLAVSPDGATLATGVSATNGNASVIRWSLHDGQQIAQIADQQEEVVAVAFSPDGKLLATASRSEVVLRDLGENRILHRLKREVAFGDDRENHHFLKFSPDGRTIAASDRCNRTMIWLVESGDCIARLENGNDGTYGLVYSDPQTLLTSNYCFLSVWDVRSKSYRNRFASHESQVYSIAIAPGSQTVVTADSAGVIRRWDAASGFSLEKAEPHAGVRTRSLLLSPDAKLGIAGQYIDGEWRTHVMDATSGKALRAFKHKDHFPIAFSLDGKMIATLRFKPNELSIWDVGTGELRASFDQSGYAAEFAADGRSIFTSSTDGPAQQLTVPEMSKLRDFVRKWQGGKRSYSGLVCGLAVSPDGRRLIVEEISGLCSYEIATGDLCWRSDTSTQLSEIAVSPDGSLVVTHNRSGVGFMNARTGKLIKTRNVGKGGVRSPLLFSPDGRRLVSATPDVIVWDVSELTKKNDERHDDRTQAQLWEDLGKDGSTSMAAIARLVNADMSTIELLKQTLRPRPKFSAELTNGLMKALDDSKFDIRDNAENELTNIGILAIAPLQEFLKTNPSAEARKRAERIIAVSQREALRLDRALEVLEGIGTPAARTLLEELGKGDPAAKFTQDAQAGVRRIDQRR